jgi:AraC-like DNA-binding protein
MLLPHAGRGRARAADTPRDAEASRIIERLEQVMESDKGFRDPTITLQSLSEQLGIQYFRLSQILNDTLHTSFRPYVNERRLAEARRLLIEKPEMSILEIAFAVGFNSKSAFNSAFSRQAACSPSDFRKNAS